MKESKANANATRAANRAHGKASDAKSKAKPAFLKIPTCKISNTLLEDIETSFPSYPQTTQGHGTEAIQSPSAAALPPGIVPGKECSVCPLFQAARAYSAAIGNILWLSFETHNP